MLRRKHTVRIVATAASVIAGVLIALLLVPVLTGARFNNELLTSDSRPGDHRPTVNLAVGEPGDGPDATDVVTIGIDGVALPQDYRLPGRMFCVADVELSVLSASDDFTPTGAVANDRSRSERTARNPGIVNIPRGDRLPPGIDENLNCTTPAALRSSSGMVRNPPASRMQRRTVSVARDSSYRFPFDSATLDVGIYVTGYARQANGEWTVEIEPAAVRALVSRTSWDVATTLDTAGARSDTARLRIQYRRPIVYRILVPVLLILAASLITATLGIEELGDQLRVVIGILFGLWGLRQVLVPEAITTPTWVDGTIIVLYAWLALIFAVRAVVIPLWRR